MSLLSLPTDLTLLTDLTLITDLWPRESPVTLAREALWRLRRSYLKHQFAHRDCFNCGSPIRFRPIGYYDCLEGLGGAIESSPLIEYAEALCRGEFCFPGYADARLGISPQWNLDFVSGKQWPEVESGGIVLVSPDGSDVKVPWELSRLQFLPLLARAFRLTGDVPSAGALSTCSPTSDCPQPSGPGHPLDGCHGSGVARGQHLPDARAAMAVSTPPKWPCCGASSVACAITCDSSRRTANFPTSAAAITT